MLYEVPVGAHVEQVVAFPADSVDRQSPADRLRKDVLFRRRFIVQTEDTEHLLRRLQSEIDDVRRTRPAAQYSTRVRAVLYFDSQTRFRWPAAAGGERGGPGPVSLNAPDANGGRKQ